MRAPDGYPVAPVHDLAELLVIVTCACGAQFIGDDYDAGAALARFDAHVSPSEHEGAE